MVSKLCPMAPWGSEQVAVWQVRKLGALISRHVCTGRGGVKDQPACSPLIEETLVRQRFVLGRSRDHLLSAAALEEGEERALCGLLESEPQAVVIGLQR